MTDALSTLLAEYMALSPNDRRVVLRCLDERDRQALTDALRLKRDRKAAAKTPLPVDLSRYSPGLSKSILRALRADETPPAARAAIEALTASSLWEGDA